MEDLLNLFVERWFIQMTVEMYYYWLHIASQGLVNAIVSELREDDFLYCVQELHFIVDEMQFQQINDFDYCVQEEPFILDEMLSQHINMDIGFNFDQDDEDEDEDEDDNDNDNVNDNDNDV